jgi:sodium--glutamate symport carrier gltS
MRLGIELRVLDRIGLCDLRERSDGILWAWLWFDIAMIIGHFINIGLEAVGLQLPKFVSCLMGGIVICNVRNFFLKTDELFAGGKLGVALISDVSLGMFNALIINFFVGL